MTTTIRSPAMSTAIVGARLIAAKPPIISTRKTSSVA